MRLFPEFVLQPAIEQRQFKCSYTLADDGPSLRGLDSRFLTKRITQRLQARGIEVRVVFSHNLYLDILPATAGKAAAVSRAADSLGLSSRNIIVAGDSGNDYDMLASSEFGIIVANHYEELDALRTHPRCYFSQHKHADGVLEGVGVFERSRIMEAQGRQV
jgi:sucrose-phosphate synthase